MVSSQFLSSSEPEISTLVQLSGVNCHSTHLSIRSLADLDRHRYLALLHLRLSLLEVQVCVAIITQDDKCSMFICTITYSHSSSLAEPLCDETRNELG